MDEERKIQIALPAWQEIVRMTNKERGQLYLLFLGYQDILRQLDLDIELLEDLILLIEGLGYWIPEALSRFQSRSVAYGDGQG